VTELTDRDARALRNDPRVRSIELDRTVAIAESESNAPRGLDRIDQHYSPLDLFYNYTATGLNVDVYIMDTGINLSHVDFGGRAHAFYDNIGDGLNGQDCTGHGTHVAGIVGGSVYGVAKQVNLYSVRVIGCDSNGYIANLVDGIDRIILAKSKGKAAKFNPMIVNISIAGAGASPALESAIESAVAKGITFVVAAGNAANDACGFTPARTPSAITVGAMDPATDLRWLGSNYGACVDIWAPGLFIDSDYIGPDTAVANLSGTSMASPFVVGVAAQYLETHRKALPAEVVNAITTNATPNMLPDAGAGSPNLLLYSNF
jgi:subtilisin family serine protease